MPQVRNDSPSAVVAELVTQHNAQCKAVADEVASVYHAAKATTVTSANASDLATSLTLVNELRVKIVAHLADALRHKAASAESIAAPLATDLTTAQTLANELKSDYNTHLTEAGVHFNNDAANNVTSADASDQSTLNTLLNEMKGDFNQHVSAHANAAPANAADVIELISL